MATVQASHDDPATSIRAVTKADALLPDGPCRMLLVGTAGDANLMDCSGQILTGVPLQAGYNKLSVQQVRTGGTAVNIWALY